MKLVISVLAATMMSAVASANSSLANLIVAQIQPQMIASVAAGVHFKVGDDCAYNMNIGGFLPGKMEMKVRNEVPEGWWIVQDVDLMIQKQSVETLIDRNDGHVIKMIANGKEQEPPAASDTEVVKMEEAKITVPQRAAPYDAIHVVLKNKKDNSTEEAWINPKEIPVSGLLKMQAQSQMGPITAELSSFARGN
jgi:hypothetical protein